MTNEFLESIGQALGFGDGSSGSGGFDIGSIFGGLTGSSLAEDSEFSFTLDDWMT